MLTSAMPSAQPCISFSTCCAVTHSQTWSSRELPKSRARRPGLGRVYYGISRADVAPIIRLCVGSTSVSGVRLRRYYPRMRRLVWLRQKVPER
ncbi:hypothetical protein N656DRAFT_275305 [Canariomyces notabilis]|uniref:Uncharacterized protein n=1 Tax=Canariomyces notabilis TaxID=2074819 RepID=A0AAN6TLT3_9PEZI|nr:hypothetical protein N656DRAFT_275305 [Canariomyces arenarius]